MTTTAGKVTLTAVPGGTLRIDVPLNPVPLERARTTDATGRGNRRRRTYTPERSAQFKQDLGWLLKGARVEVLEDPLEVGLRFWRRCQSSANRGDIDNLEKAVLDGAQGFLWRNDAQVERLTTEIVKAGPDVTGWITIEIRRRPSAHERTELDQAYDETRTQLEEHLLLPEAERTPAGVAFHDQYATAMRDELARIGVHLTSPAERRALVGGLAVLHTALRQLPEAQRACTVEVATTIATITAGALDLAAA